MKRLFHKDIDSTSLEAFRLLEKGLEPPFAISAEKQSTGRGQHSRKWESPKGNVYLTIVNSIPNSKLPLLPLLVSVILTNFLQEKITVPIQVKWPNDLLIDKKKFAGILCETLYKKENDESTAIIGLGINVESHPPLELTPYPTEKLCSYFKERMEVLSLIDEFLNFWEKFPSYSKEEILKTYASLHLPTGTLWSHVEEEGVLYTNSGFSKDGYLQMKNLETEREETLISAQNPFRLLREGIKSS